MSMYQSYYSVNELSPDPFMLIEDSDSDTQLYDIDMFHLSIDSQRPFLRII